MQKHIQDIKNNYRKMERELVTQLNYEVGNHQGTAGTNREEIWVDFFRRIVPKKFNIARSVFIIDSKGNCSNEVDIAIYDEQYTPYIFNYGSIKFIPVEAVAAVVQCKSKNLNGDSLKKWAKSVGELQTSVDSIARIAAEVHIGVIKNAAGDPEGSKSSKPIQTATTPIKLLCHLNIDESKTENSYGRNHFDIVIEAYQKRSETKDSSGETKNNKEENKDDKIAGRERDRFDGNLKITFHKNKNLYDVLCQYNRANMYRLNKEMEGILKSDVEKVLKERKLDDYRIEENEEEYTLLSFIFQFNQMLMLINNPMFFPHKAYVDMFNGKTQRGDE